MAVAHAHGRANLIGEHTDYNDGLVLPCLISNRTEVALAMRNDDLVCGISNQFSAGQKAVHDRLDGRWLDFVIGALHQLLPVGGRFQGLDIAVKSNIPPVRVSRPLLLWKLPCSELGDGPAIALSDGSAIGRYGAAD